jgi:hypothetical protein
MNVSKGRLLAGVWLVTSTLAACGGEGVTRAVVADAGGGDAARPVSDATPILPDAGPDATPAEIGLTIEAPLEGQWVNTRRFEVRGRFTGPANAVDVNGVAAVLDADTFRAFVTLAPGPGVITVTAGATTATVNVTVDPAPPRIDITAPLRGTWVEDLTAPLAFRVADDNGLTGVYLNERRLPGAGPEFSLDAPLARGLNVLTARADDVAGNISRESVAILAGPTRDPALPIGGAFRVHLGPRGLQGVGAEAARYLDDLDLRGFLPAEPFDVGGVLIEVADVRHAHRSTVSLVPDAFELAVDVHVEAVEIDVEITINETPYGATISAAGLDLTGILAPNVVEGEIQTGVRDLALDLVDFGVDLSGIPAFGNDPAGEENLLEQLVEELARSLANERVPGLLDQALADFDRVFDTTVLGVPLRVTVVPEELLVRGDGLALKAGAGVELISPPVNAPAAPGYPGRVSGWDGVPEGDDLSVAVDDDLINLVLFQFWRAGIALPVIDRAFLAANPGAAEQVQSVLAVLLSSAYPELGPNAPVRLSTAFTLPPVVHVVGSDGGAGLTIGLGDLGVNVDTDDGQRRRLIDGVASIVLEGALSVDTPAGGAPALSARVTRTTAVFDVLTEALRGEVEAGIEGPMNVLLGSLGGIVTDLLSGLPLPSLGSLPVSGLQVRVEPNASDFLRIDAEITRRAD